ncbi:TlpA family protein disulfide reductase [Dactylosporangium roseum]|uniref:TlpA family protein disulfide reductase n=1 Tax=Dactylosporangium roseum TaxID=47989 RepID=A0ABY5Z6U5_9ACTN|nr:TlpA disulfide reductase family protein [Dactylosporangium roseum]UWZ37207.1 TlpA family protein disulfide reductase [Dactylosporangium roseum]
MTMRTATRPLAGLLTGILLALAGCTANTTAPSGDPGAIPSGPRCIEPAPTGTGSTGGTGSASAAAPDGKSRPALPAMALQCFNGGRWTSLSDLVGTPTIINLWASYCEPCRTELPAIQRVATAGAGEIHVVGIVTRDRTEAARSVIDAKGLTFPMLEDKGQQFAIATGPLVDKALVSLPATLFVTADGRIAYAYQGPALDESKLRDLTSQYLGVTVPA